MATPETTKENTWYRSQVMLGASEIRARIAREELPFQLTDVTAAAAGKGARYGYLGTHAGTEWYVLVEKITQSAAV